MGSQRVGHNWVTEHACMQAYVTCKILERPRKRRLNPYIIFSSVIPPSWPLGNHVVHCHGYQWRRQSHSVKGLHRLKDWTWNSAAETTETCFEPSFGFSLDSGVLDLDVESLCSRERSGRDGSIVFKSRQTDLDGSPNCASWSKWLTSSSLK